MKAQEDLQEELKVAKEFGWFGWERKPAIWDAVARNVLNKDLGQYEDSYKVDYELDDETRDQLIAHARQDAAMAFYAAKEAYEQASSARLNSWLSLIVLLIILYKVW